MAYRNPGLNYRNQYGDSKKDCLEPPIINPNMHPTNINNMDYSNKDSRIRNSLLDEIYTDFSAQESFELDLFEMERQYATNQVNAIRTQLELEDSDQLIPFGEIDQLAEKYSSEIEMKQREGLMAPYHHHHQQQHSSYSYMVPYNKNKPLVDSSYEKEFNHNVASPTISSSCEPKEEIKDEPVLKTEEDIKQEAIASLETNNLQELGGSVKMKAGEKSNNSSNSSSPSQQMHAAKKQRIISCASKLLEEVRESYAYIQGADMYAPPTLPQQSQSYANYQNMSQFNPDRGGNLNFDFTGQSQRNFKFNASNPSRPNYNLDNNPPIANTASNNNNCNNNINININNNFCGSNFNCSNNPGLIGPIGSSSGSGNNSNNNNVMGNNFFINNNSLNFNNVNINNGNNLINLQNVKKPTTPVKPPPYPHPPNHLQDFIQNSNPIFTKHPLYKLLRDIIIADMNFNSPSFPFSLILNLPEHFERLIHNYMSRNPDLNLDQVDPYVHPMIMDALKFAHSTLISKIQAKKLEEGYSLVNKVHTNNNSNVDDLCDYFAKHDNFTSSALGNPPPFTPLPKIQPIGDGPHLKLNQSPSINSFNHQSFDGNFKRECDLTPNFLDPQLRGNNNQQQPYFIPPHSPHHSNFGPTPNHRPYSDSYDHLTNDLNNGPPMIKGQMERFNPGLPPFLPPQPPHHAPSPLHLSSSTSSLPYGIDCSPSPQHHPSSTLLPSQPPPLLNHHQHLMFMMENERRGVQSLPSSPRKMMMMRNAHHPMMMMMKGGGGNSGAGGGCVGEMGVEKTGKNKVLPKEAVNAMIDWLRKHEDNPYPNDDEKESLINQTKLTINQINYWFTNARRRILPKWALQRHLEEQERAKSSSSSSSLHSNSNNNNNNNGNNNNHHHSTNSISGSHTSISGNNNNNNNNEKAKFKSGSPNDFLNDSMSSIKSTCASGAN